MNQHLAEWRDRAAASVPRHRWLSAFAAIRFSEVLVLEGPPLLGALCAVGALVPHSLGKLAVLIAANGCLVGHIFALNDWAGYSADRLDPHRSLAARIGPSAGASRTALLQLSLLLLAVGATLLALLGIQPLVLGAGIALLSALYSGPLSSAKGVPLASSLLHLVGGVLHFLLGYSIFGAIDLRGFALAAFTALLFTAGHLVQEVRDEPGDRGNRITTNAVRYGRDSVFRAGLVFFALADLELIVLAALDVVPRWLLVLIVVMPLQILWSRSAGRAQLNPPSMRQLQIRYRLLYGAIGAAIVIAFCLRG
jgi:4-hydroxybenzoate polyprenyltransferase